MADIQNKIYKRNNFYWKYFERPKRIITGWIEKNLLGKGLNNNAKFIQKEIDKHRYELVYFSPFDVYFLLGWTDQYDEDYYYVVWEDRKGIRLISCVAGFIWLKKKLTKHEYYSATSTWLCNNKSIKETLQEAKKKKIKIK